MTARLTEKSYIGVEVAGGSCLIIERVAYDESMKWALYRASCSTCAGFPTLWIEIETGRWKWERRCISNHRGLEEAKEQRVALLLACAA